MIETSPTALPLRLPPIRRVAPPPLNPALSELEPAAADALRAVLMMMGDSELVIGHRHSEWTGFAPSAEEDVAFSSIAQDEMGHAHLYYALLVGADNEANVDRLALDRGPRAFRHLPVLHAPNGDWFFTIARHFFWDVLEDVFLRAALDSSAPLLGSAARRLLNEEQYHVEHAQEWIDLLSGSSRPRARLSRGLARVFRLAGNPFSVRREFDAAAAAGLLLHSGDLAAKFRAAVVERLGGRLTAGEMDIVLAQLGPDGHDRVPPGLLRLHTDLTGLRRAHPGATW